MRQTVVAAALLATLAIASDAHATCGPGDIVTYTVDLKMRKVTHDVRAAPVKADGEPGPRLVAGDRVFVAVIDVKAQKIGVRSFDRKTGAARSPVMGPIGNERLMGDVVVVRIDATHLQLRATGEICFAP